MKNICHSLSLSLSLSYMYSYENEFSLTNSFSLSHSNSFSISLTHSHTNIKNTHSLTLTSNHTFFKSLLRANTTQSLSAHLNRKLSDTHWEKNDAEFWLHHFLSSKAIISLQFLIYSRNLY